MPDVEREVAIKVTGANVSGAAMVDVSNGLVAIRTDAGSTSAAAKQLAADWTSMRDAAVKGTDDTVSGVKKAHGATQEWGTSLESVKGLLEGFGLALGVHELIRFGEEVVGRAHDIEVMAAKFNISTDAVQRLSYAADQTGASMESIGKAMKVLSVAVVEDSSKTEEVLRSIGLRASDLRGLKMEDLFNTVAEAIRNCPDPLLQTEAAVRLLGRSGADELPAIKQGLVDIGKQAPIMAEETVKGLADAEKTWKDFWAHVEVYSADAINVVANGIKAAGKSNASQFMMMGSGMGGLSPAVSAALQQQIAAQGAVTESAKTETATVEHLTEAQKALRAATQAVAAQHVALSDALKPAVTMMVNAGMSASEIEKKFKAAGVETGDYSDAIGFLVEQHKKEEEAVKKATTAQKAHDDALKDLKSSASDLTATQRTQIETLLTAGKSEADIAKAYGYTTQQVKDVAQAEKERAELLAWASGEQDKYYAAQQKIADGIAKQIGQNYLATVKAEQAADDQIKKNTLGLYEYKRQKLIDEMNDKLRAYQGDEAGYERYYDALVDETNAGMDAIDKELATAALKSYNETKQHTQAQSELAKEMTATFGELDRAVEGSFAQMILGAKSFHDGFLDIWNSLKSALSNIVSEMLSDVTHRLIGGMLNALSGNSFGSAFQGFLGGGGGGISGVINGTAGANAGAGAGGASAGGGLGGVIGAIAGPIAAAAIIAEAWNSVAPISAIWRDDGNHGNYSDYADAYNQGLADYDAQARADNPGAFPEFAEGTRGRFVDFGPETLVKLHGREKVVTENEERQPPASGESTTVVHLYVDGALMQTAIEKRMRRDAAGRVQFRTTLNT